MATEESREKKRNNIQQCYPMIIHTCSLMSCPEPVRMCCAAAGQRHFRDPGKLLPDAVFVGYSNARRERVELHHGGDAWVPVEEDLIIQPGNTCGGTGGSHSSAPGNIPPGTRLRPPPASRCHVSPLSSSFFPVLTNRHPPQTLSSFKNLPRSQLSDSPDSSMLIVTRLKVQTKKCDDRSGGP